MHLPGKCAKQLTWFFSFKLFVLSFFYFFFFFNKFFFLKARKCLWPHITLLAIHTIDFLFFWFFIQFLFFLMVLHIQIVFLENLNKMHKFYETIYVHTYIHMYEYVVSLNECNVNSKIVRFLKKTWLFFSFLFYVKKMQVRV